MHRTVFKRADGGVSIGGDNSHIIAAMTSNGGLIPRASESISAAHLAYIQSYAANPAVQAILDRVEPLKELDYEIAKAVAIDGYPEPIARANFEGKAFGGLSESDAHDALAAYHAEGVRVSVGPVISYHHCEDTDLPSDRYFRNAWEWSD
jgi:hypothetical protein